MIKAVESAREVMQPPPRSRYLRPPRPAKRCWVIAINMPSRKQIRSFPKHIYPDSKLSPCVAALHFPSKKWLWPQAFWQGQGHQWHPSPIIMGPSFVQAKAILTCRRWDSSAGLESKSAQADVAAGVFVNAISRSGCANKSMLGCVSTWPYIINILSQAILPPNPLAIFVQPFRAPNRHHHLVHSFVEAIGCSMTVS